MTLRYETLLKHFYRKQYLEPWTLPEALSFLNVPTDPKTRFCFAMAARRLREKQAIESVGYRGHYMLYRVKP